MNIKKIKPDSIGLLAGGVLISAVGVYTGNDGFQFAGAILLLVASILAFNQASEPSEGQENK